MKFKKGDYVYYYKECNSIPCVIIKVTKKRYVLSDGERIYKNIKESNVEKQE